MTGHWVQWKDTIACLSDFEAGGEVRPGRLRARWGQLVWLTARSARWGARSATRGPPGESRGLLVRPLGPCEAQRISGPTICSP